MSSIKMKTSPHLFTTFTLIFIICRDVELLQQSASSSEEIEAYKNEILSLRADLEQARQKEVELETAKASFEALEIEHKTATKEQEEKLTTITNELKESTEALQKIIAEREEKESDLLKAKQELEAVISKSDETFRSLSAEKDAAIKEVELLREQFTQEKEVSVVYGLVNSIIFGRRRCLLLGL